MPTCKRRNDCFSVLIYPDLSYFVTCNLLFCECPARPDYVNQVLIHQKNENQETVSYSPFRPCENTRRAGNVVWIINSQGTACCSLAFGLSFRQVTDLSSKITLRQIHQSSYADPAAMACIRSQPLQNDLVDLVKREWPDQAVAHPVHQHEIDRFGLFLFVQKKRTKKDISFLSSFSFVRFL